MSTLSQFSGGGIKSIQRGVITFTGSQVTATATITAVNTAKTMLNFCGSRSGSYSGEYAVLASISLTSSTQITAMALAVYQAFSGTAAPAVSYEVIEYF